MASLEQFSKRIVLRGKSVSRNADRLTRKVALAADQAVVMGTPVDTGRARSNWIVQVGSAPSSVIEAYSEGKGLGRGENANAAAALAQGEQAVSGYVGGKGQAIHITNNVPYIGKLNEGSSAQAPEHFVETAVLQAVDVVSKGRLISSTPTG